MNQQERINTLFDSLFDKIPGGLFGITSMIIGLGGDLLAALFYPNYSIFEDMISNLGISWISPGGFFLTLE